jgi:hypothetical protein
MTVFLLSYQYDQNIALFAETGQDGLSVFHLLKIDP